MLNLSDKELDRLSREAASSYDPGEPAGAGSWSRLELTLDKELGRVSPGPLHTIRRIPFYYAPVVALLVGASYYFLKQGKGNSRAAPAPASPVNPLSITQNNSDKPNSTHYNDQTPAGKAEADNHLNNASAPATASGTTSAPAPAPGSAASGTAAASGKAPASGLSTSSGRTSGSAEGKTAHSNPGYTKSKGLNSRSGHNLRPVTDHSPGQTASDQPGQTNTADQLAQQHKAGHSGRHITTGHPGHDLAADQSTQKRTAGQSGSGQQPSGLPGQPSSAALAGQQRPAIPSGQQSSGLSGNQTATAQATQSQTADPSRSVVSKPYFLSAHPVISDSALRKIKTANTAALINMDKKSNQSLHINRSLQLGFTVAPDFASVHSLAGDRPGSVTGITLDYQFFNRWYIGTGLLYSRRNYTARSEDFHAPPYYYQMNNMHDVNYIKGRFSMLEIPINLRYDFSVANNTIFFASAGVSSYLRNTENCDYYYSFYGREAYRKFSYPVQHSPIFSVVNLSMGIEAGISNSFSFLVAPYMKIPTSAIGFGQIQMNSIGVDFSLKYAPVLKRKRK